MSVRSLLEARSALVGGCRLVDVKDPARGPLGMADPAILHAISTEIQGFSARAELSFALGELADWQDFNLLREIPRSVDYLKVGLAGQTHDEVRKNLGNLRTAIQSTHPTTRCIVVAYADQLAARSISPDQAIAIAHEQNWQGVLIDTCAKRGPGLSGILTPSECARFAGEAARRGLSFGLAGKLTIADLAWLRFVRPNIVGIRSAACRLGSRDHDVSAELVSAFRQALELIDFTTAAPMVESIEPAVLPLGCDTSKAAESIRPLASSSLGAP